MRWSRVASAGVVTGLLLAGCSGQSDQPGTPLGAFSAPVTTPATPAPSASGDPSGSSGPSASPSPGVVKAVPSSTKPASLTYRFPVIGTSSYGHTHHDYPATDIITRCGNPVVAVTTGTVLAVRRTDEWNASENAGATRGGLSVSLLGDDGARYYGSHLSVIADNIKPGTKVTAGQTLGKTGDTGDSSACHLHFGISPPCARTGDWWIQRGTIWPWPYLDAWRQGKNRSAAAETKAWQSRHGCPKKPLTDP
jgi:murein DD-endopeptidase MepM/ murein hydrolase activator NlpD